MADGRLAPRARTWGVQVVRRGGAVGEVGVAGNGVLAFVAAGAAARPAERVPAAGGGVGGLRGEVAEVGDRAGGSAWAGTWSWGAVSADIGSMKPLGRRVARPVENWLGGGLPAACAPDLGWTWSCEILDPSLLFMVPTLVPAISADTLRGMEMRARKRRKASGGPGRAAWVDIFVEESRRGGL